MQISRKLVGAAAFAAAIAGGGVAGALIGAPGISLAQEDPTTTTVADDADDAGDAGEAGDEDRCRPGLAFRGERLETAAEAIGISVDELREALADGESIASVAEANDVDVQTVIDALVAEADERLDQAVEDDELTAEKADEIRADLEERITEMVEREGLPHRHRFHHRMDGAREHDAPADDEADAGS